MHLLPILFNGIKMGLVLSVLVGPVFFTIIQTSVERGFKSGALVSLGVSASDILYVTVCYFGLVQILDEPRFKLYMAYGGAIMLVLFGLYHLVIKSRKIFQAAGKVTGKSTYQCFMKGFIINGLSPMVPIFWVGAIGIASLDFGYAHHYEFISFFTVVLMTVLATDLLKAYLAGRLRQLVTQRMMTILNIVVGIGLFAFGIRLWLMAGSFQS
ncbi:MAG: LysE family transporter [Cyclobacteriaceae bacterium]|nr:LysE family transporter [Cyclobacteriaceae bacterium]